MKAARRVWSTLLLVAAAVALSLVVRVMVVESFLIPSNSMAPTLLSGDHILVDKLAYGPRLPFTGRRLFVRGSPARGDIVVFADPRNPSADFVKRIVGLPGDRIELREQVVYVNDVPQRRSSQGTYAYDELTGRDKGANTCAAFMEELTRGPVLPPASDRPEDLEAAFETAALAGRMQHRLLQCGETSPGERQGPFTVTAASVFVMGDNRDRSDDSRGGWLVPISNIEGRVTRIAWSWGSGDGMRSDRLFRKVE